MQLLWKHHYQYWRFILIDAHKTLNEENHTSMLWDVWFKWPSGARFTFNFYCYCDTLMICNVGGTGCLICSKEGVTQGNPLDMILYGIRITTLIRELQAAHPQVIQLRYANDDGERGSLPHIQIQLDNLMLQGPACGYFL